MGVNMNVKQIVNRAFMQIGDTSQLKYTPYLLCEYYNEGNQLLHSMVAKYMPRYNEKKYVAVGKGLIELPIQAIAINGVSTSERKIEDYTVSNLKTITFEAEIEDTITVEYVPSCSFKYLTDDSDYPSEFESMLVAYIVTRALGGDVASVAANWSSIISDIASNSGSNESVVIAKGYYNYDSPRIDYDD